MRVEKRNSSRYLGKRNPNVDSSEAVSARKRLQESNAWYTCDWLENKVFRPFKTIWDLPLQLRGEVTCLVYTGHPFCRIHASRGNRIWLLSIHCLSYSRCRISHLSKKKTKRETSFRALSHKLKAQSLYWNTYCSWLVQLSLLFTFLRCFPDIVVG